MASPGSYIRSAARATYSAYRSVPIRWRLAGGSAALTFVLLAGFAGIVGVLTSRQVRGQFDDEVSSAVDQLQSRLHLRFVGPGDLNCNKRISLSDYASAERAQIRIFDAGSGDLLCTQSAIPNRIKGTTTTLPKPNFPTPTGPGTFQELGYRVVVRDLRVRPSGGLFLLYARPLSDLDRTVARVRVFLWLGVLGVTILALLAGLATAQRAMRPVAELSDAAREIERTRDPSLRLPHPEAEDEVAELARTLEGMLGALDDARGDTLAMLDRQREFVADASHELRTPLTSVLANLEILTEELDGDQAETAEAALRSTRRMRRLVGDLLLLARADAKRAQPFRQTDLGEVLLEAAAELGPMADQHKLSISAEPALVTGVRDDLHRLALNLLENAVRHTPPGTQVRASTGIEGGHALMTVEDDGPGIPREIEHRVFERFVRSGRDGARGSGLGLAIVRAVAESHGGTVELEQAQDGAGTRFVIRIPGWARSADPEELAAGAPGQASGTTL
ncbi:MAG TPA: HAMP domain-containing sensor histidine kinase [Solirubrobacteraceae bacterium]